MGLEPPPPKKIKKLSVALAAYKPRMSIHQFGHARFEHRAPFAAVSSVQKKRKDYAQRHRSCYFFFFFQSRRALQILFRRIGLFLWYKCKEISIGFETLLQLQQANPSLASSYPS